MQSSSSIYATALNVSSNLAELLWQCSQVRSGLLSAVIGPSWHQSLKVLGFLLSAIDDDRAEQTHRLPLRLSHKRNSVQRLTTLACIEHQIPLKLLSRLNLGLKQTAAGVISLTTTRICRAVHCMLPLQQNNPR